MSNGKNRSRARPRDWEQLGRRLQRMRRLPLTLTLQDRALALSSPNEDRVRGLAAAAELPRRDVHRLTRQTRQQGMQCRHGRAVADAVDLGGTEMTLEGGDHFHGRAVIL